MSRDRYTTRILVVEDQHLMRELTIESLNSIGFGAVEGDENGAKALERMDEETFDIVLSDIEMEPVNGLELVRAIRAGDTPQNRALPVVFLTGFSDMATLALASELQVQAYVVKPASANLLCEKIDMALRHETALRSPTEYRAMTSETATAAAPKVQQAVESTDNSRKKIDVLMLSEGMILRQDAKARGRVLLTAGTRLLEAHISVLLDMRALLDERELDVSIPG